MGAHTAAMARARRLVCLINAATMAAACGVIPLPPSGAALEDCNRLAREGIGRGGGPITVVAAFDTDVAGLRRVAARSERGSNVDGPPGNPATLCYLDGTFELPFRELAERMVVGYTVDPRDLSPRQESAEVWTLGYGDASEIPVLAP